MDLLRIYSSDGGTDVLAESNGANQTCQIQPNAPRSPYFGDHGLPGIEGGTVQFRVTVTDLDGADDLETVSLRRSGTAQYSLALAAHSRPDLPSTIILTLDKNFNSTELTTDARSLEVRVEDRWGITPAVEWTPTGRSLKVWDCKVPISGTIYDSSSIQTAVCPSSWATYPLASEGMNFEYTIVQRGYSQWEVMPNPPPANYGPRDDVIFWGRDYRVSPNSDLAASNIVRQWVDNGDAPVSPAISCPGVAAWVDNNIVSPYSSAPSLLVNMAGIQSGPLVSGDFGRDHVPDSSSGQSGTGHLSI